MPVKIYISNDNMATFTCPECSKSRTVDVSKYKHAETAIKVKCKCKCGCSYTAVLERRQYFRKETNFPGRYVTVRGEKGLMTVVDISRSGLGIKLSSKPNFKIGDKLTVEFNLDDQPRSLINREVIIMSIRDLNVGTEFSSMDHYDRLGPYLF